MSVTRYYEVTGMKCAGCAAKVERAAASAVRDLAQQRRRRSEESGTTRANSIVSVDFLSKRLTLDVGADAYGDGDGDGDEQQKLEEIIREAVRSEGFEIRGRRSPSDEKTLGEADDVSDPTNALQEQQQQTELQTLRGRLRLSASLTAPLAALHLADLANLNLAAWESTSALAGPLLQLGLSAPVVALVAWPTFVRPAWLQVRTSFAERRRRSGGSVVLPAMGMDTLLSLGVISAFGGSLVSLLIFPGGPHLYFEAASMITTSVVAGRFLEARATLAASSSLATLGSLLPREVRRVRRKAENVDDLSSIETVLLDHIQKGDVLLVRPGDRVPVDGLLFDNFDALEFNGETASLPPDGRLSQIRAPPFCVDNSLMTGESSVGEEVPVGGAVFSGALNIDTRSFYVVARVVGEQTRFREMVSAVDRAQRSKPEIQRLADRVSALFTPAVVFLTASTALSWTLLAGDGVAAFESSLALAVAACPCALGLATPVAVQVAVDSAARAGILLRNATTLERASSVRTVVFDKTGTLTVNRPRVVDWHFSPRAHANWSEIGIFELALALEQRAAAHPLAMGISEFARSQLRELRTDQSPVTTKPQPHNAKIIEAIGCSPVSSVIGAGVEVQVDDGSSYSIGSRAFCESRATSDLVLSPPGDWAERGLSVVGLMAEGQLLAYFALADEVRPYAAQEVEALHRMGIDVVIASGDSPQAVAATARAIGVRADRAFGGLTPDQKVELVQSIRAQTGSPVAMFGDGLNDAAALAAADVSVAINTDVDVAVAQSDAVFVSADIRGVTDLLQLSSRTVSTIRGNLGWAFGYNAVMLPLAALHILPASVAGAAMALSSVTVVLNSLRLSTFRRSQR